MPHFMVHFSGSSDLIFSNTLIAPSTPVCSNNEYFEPVEFDTISPVRTDF